MIKIDMKVSKDPVFLEARLYFPNPFSTLGQDSVHYNVALSPRILKEAMRAGGSNVTPKHAEDISLSGLFLMDVTKTIDHEFGVHHSSSHTTRDAFNDIVKLSDHLIDPMQRNSPLFSDPTLTGLDKMCNTTWIQNTLSRTELFEETARNCTTDINYELTDVL